MTGRPIGFEAARYESPSDIGRFGKYLLSRSVKVTGAQGRMARHPLHSINQAE
jgi:hypothetical protein